MEKDDDGESEIGSMIEKRRLENEAFAKLLKEIEIQKNAVISASSKRKTK